MLTNTFLIKLKQQYLEKIAQINKSGSFVKKEWEFKTKVGAVEVDVIRGGLFEKACVSNIRATVVIPGRSYESTIQWVGIQTFPANPQIPIFMGVFEHVSEQGLEHCPGFFDVFPTVPYAEDREVVRGRMEMVAEKHGRQYQDLRAGYLKMFQQKETGSGIGYGVGIAFQPEEDNAAYFEDTAQEIFTAYFGLVDKRKDQKPTAEQMELMAQQRREWVRYTFMDNRFYQGGVQFGVPPEAFMLHMLPPSVTF
jgi:coproporphyrinogen III oxidase